MNFFKPPDPKEIQRKQQRELKSANRDLERDMRELEREEKKIEADIKKAAKQGNQALAKTLAKQLIRLRQTKEKNMTAQSNITGAGHQMKAMSAQVTVAKAMGTTSKVMGSVNKQVSVQKLQQTAMQFQKANAEMDMKGEMMNDVIDDVMGEEEDEEESAAIMNQVLDEIGIGIGTSMASVPKGKLPTRQQEQEDDKEADDLMARLQGLKQ